MIASASVSGSAGRANNEGRGSSDGLHVVLRHWLDIRASRRRATGPLVTSPARALRRLAGRYDHAAFEPQGGRARVRLAVLGSDTWDVVIDGGAVCVAPAEGDADATLAADAQTWTAIADDVRGGMDAYRSGRLTVRRNLHVGVGLLAATSGLSAPE